MRTVPEASRAPGDLYFGVFRTLPILVYNEERVSEEEAPRDWDELLSPRFAGKVLIRDPIASGVMRSIFGMVVARSIAETGSTEAGFAWLSRLDAATKEYVANPALLHQKIVRGEGDVTMWELTDTLLERAKGVALGYRPPVYPNDVFVWQLGAVRDKRGADLMMRLLDELLSRPGSAGARFLCMTRSALDGALQDTLQNLARRRSVRYAEVACFPATYFAEPHPEELLVRIGPLDAAR